jgi:1,4-dihydroxy-2-naphthoyl-CoA hydrolase
VADDLRDISSPFDELIGTQWLDSDPDHARVKVELRDELCQPIGLMHGGVILTLIESVCSWATMLAVVDEGKLAMGQSINVNFVRPISAGSAEVKAHARHRGRSSWVWQIEVLDDRERLCALGQITIAVRPVDARTVAFVRDSRTNATPDQG